MGWSNSVITNTGLSLISQAVSGGTLTITSAGLGGGTVETAALMAQTALSTPLTVPVVISAKDNLDNGLTVRVQIRNTGVTVEQRMKQVGLFAKIGDDDPVLFAIMQDETGEEIPTAVEYPDFMIEFTAAIAVSNTENIEVTISSSAVITRGALDEELKNYTPSDKFNELSTSVSNLQSSKANKTDVEEALKGKSNTDHKHTVANITDFPPSLPANGGNADTLNGLNIGYFYIHHGDVPDNDCDNARGMGTYNAVPETVNTPFSNYWHIIVEYATNGNWIKQTATLCDKTNPVAYYRLFINNGDWGDWIKVNDGGNANYVKTLNESGTSFGESFLMTAQYNKGSDGTFRIFCGDGSVWTSVNRADEAAYANSSGLSESISCLRNISAGTADLTAGSSTLATGAIYLVYE